MADSNLITGWHRIGAHIGGASADVARRLGREAGLPVFRLSTKKIAAFRSDLDRWLTDRRDGGLKDRAA